MLFVSFVDDSFGEFIIGNHLKLDELIRAVERADNTLLDLEEIEEEELALLRRKYVGLARVAREEQAKTSSTGEIQGAE